MDVNVILEGGLSMWEPLEQERGGGYKSEIFANVIHEWPHVLGKWNGVPRETLI